MVVKTKPATRKAIKAEPKNLTEECLLSILDLLKNGDLKPGDHVGEISIAQKIGMGRAPTRSALDRLAQAGVFERIPRSGTFVREIGLKEFSDLMDVRACLESLSARLASQFIEEADTENLLALGKKADHVYDNSSDITAAERFHFDSDFHLFVAEASKNQRLYALLENQHLLESALVAGARIVPQQWHLRAQIPTHEQIARAIVERCSEEAGDLMREHILKTKQIRINLTLGGI